MTKQQTETSDQAAKQKTTMHDQYNRQQQTEGEEQAAKRKKTERDSTRRKHEKMRHQSQKYNRGCNGEMV